MDQILIIQVLQMMTIGEAKLELIVVYMNHLTGMMLVMLEEETKVRTIY